MQRSVDANFWKNKKVLVTGHTGFKGSWLSLWLQSMDANVRGVSLAPTSEPNLFNIANVQNGLEHYIADIRDLNAMRFHVSDFNPDIIIHMAAQPLVRRSYKEPVETFETNVMGTVNVLEAARSGTNIRAIVNVTTDKCYENREWPWGYRENEAMGGHDPYSSSKGCVELISSAYKNSFFVEAGIAIGTARAGNVIGGGDWSEDRLLPDILRALQSEEPVAIRNPNAIRPWQHVLEPLSGYLMLAENLFGVSGQRFAEGWNFGPLDEDAKPVGWIVKEMCDLWPGNNTWVSQDGGHPHEANFLKLDISKAKEQLNWRPAWDLAKGLSKTIDWHQAWINGKDMHDFSLQQISAYSMRPL